MTAPRLGIIAGAGDLPFLLAAACRDEGRDYFILGLRGQTDPERITEHPHGWIRMGAVGKGLAMLSEAGARELVMAGPVRRPSLAELRPDARGAAIVARIGFARSGDDTVLKGVIAELEREGFRIVGIDDVLGALVGPKGVQGRHAPDDQALADIARAVAVARAVGELDVGQAAVVQEGIVLAVEAAEGTDAMLARCAGLAREGAGGVLVKVAKPGQERRADLPTVGATTVANAAEAGLRGIAYQAGASILVGREATVAEADRRGLFLVGVEVPE